jgi:hypothetical protein
VATGVAGLLIIVIVGLIVWLRRAKTRQKNAAETATDGLGGKPELDGGPPTAVPRGNERNDALVLAVDLPQYEIDSSDPLKGRAELGGS